MDTGDSGLPGGPANSGRRQASADGGSRLLRPVGVPAAILLLLLALLGVFLLQDRRMAAARHRRLLPVRSGRPLALDPTVERVVERSTQNRFLLCDLGSDAPVRLALYQSFPQRTLIRWLENARPDGPGELLVLPLEGLDPGHYLLCAADSTTRDQARDMDRPPETLRILGRIELRQGR